jgi:dynactin complex subunit
MTTVASGRVAYIGEVHFAAGEMAGIHLEEPCGKNNGTVGGRMYFQCEPRRGLFSRCPFREILPLRPDKFC